MARNILVLGTGRSGTSAVGGVLHRLGVDMGGPFVPADQTNPWGTYEDRAFRELDLRVIAGDESPEAFYGYIQGYLKTRGGKLWGLKDPTLVFTAHHLISYLMKDSRIDDVRIVVCRRAREKCIDSYQRAYDASYQRAAEWYEQVSDALNQRLQEIDSTKIFEVEFNELRDDPVSVTGALATFVYDGLDEKPTQAQLEEAAAFVRKEPGVWPRVGLGILLERTCPSDVVLHGLDNTRFANTAFHAFIRISRTVGTIFEQTPARGDIARDRFARTLLESDCSHLLMLDIDHIHPADIVPRLTRWVEADKHKLVVGGMNFRRSEPFDVCGFVKGPDGIYYSPTDWPPGLMKVDILGSGCILISREVFEYLPGPPWFAHDYSHAAEGNYPGQDVGFSKLCEQYDIDLWMDTTTTSPHIVGGLVDANTCKSYVNAQQEATHGRTEETQEDPGRPGDDGRDGGSGDLHLARFGHARRPANHDLR